MQFVDGRNILFQYETSSLSLTIERWS